MELTQSRTAVGRRFASPATSQLRTLLASCIRRAVLLFAIGSLVPFGLTAQDSAPSFKLSPQVIQMGAFYNGARVRIEGTAPSGSQVLVVIRGDEKDAFFNKKGRVGPIWVNTDKIHIAQAPSLFLSFSSADVSSILDRAAIETYQLDESAIKNRMLCRSHCKCSSTKAHATLAECAGTEPDPSYRELIRRSYLALKSREGSYQTHPNIVQVADASDGARYSLDLDWSRKAPPGSYQVEVFACQNRSVVARSSAILQVVEVGFPAQIATLAAVHPWRYGGMAVLIAALAGFTIDALTALLRRRPWGKAGPKGKRGEAAWSRPEPAHAETAAEDSPVEEHAHHS